MTRPKPDRAPTSLVGQIDPKEIGSRVEQAVLKDLEKKKKKAVADAQEGGEKRKGGDGGAGADGEVYEMMLSAVHTVLGDQVQDIVWSAADVVLETLKEELLRSRMSHQSKLYPIAFGINEPIPLCAPTSAGKTNVVVLASLSGGETGRLQQIAETQIIVTTPEKWDVITWKSTDNSYINLACLIIEEIHLLHDDPGPVLEVIIAHVTVEVCTLSLKEHSKLKGLFEVISSSTEFETIPIRYHEGVLLHCIYDRVPVKLDQADFKAPHLKATTQPVLPSFSKSHSHAMLARTKKTRSIHHCAILTPNPHPQETRELVAVTKSLAVKLEFALPKRTHQLRLHVLVIRILAVDENAMDESVSEFDADEFNAKIAEAVLKTPTAKCHRKRKASSPPKPITPGGLGTPIPPPTTPAAELVATGSAVHILENVCSFANIVFNTLRNTLTSTNPKDVSEAPFMVSNDDAQYIFKSLCSVWSFFKHEDAPMAFHDVGSQNCVNWHLYYARLIALLLDSFSFPYGAFDDVLLTISGEGSETITATQIIERAIKHIPSISAKATPSPPATKPASVVNPKPTAKGLAKIAHLLPKKPAPEHKKPAADKPMHSFTDAL
ncbi:Pre-mRNA-splicing factor brr2 [Leucoagaricus sp. SymC.cos]|nr:Pre-mRNA-splicing factor brr2 [Leucoagaricus sp. SymC.cos]